MNGFGSIAGRWIGGLLYGLDSPHRRIVQRNLAFAYPEWQPADIRRMSRKVFENFGRTLIEIIRLPRLSAADVFKEVTLKGEDHLLEAARNPRGAIFISAHLGNWEIAPMAVACYSGRSMVSVARPLQSAYLNRWILRTRSRFGNSVLFKDGAFTDMARILREGRMLGILIDQGVLMSEGVTVRFFDRDVTATPGAALLAMRCKSPVYPGYCIRNPDGSLQVEFRPALALQRTGNLREDVRVNTQRMTSEIEAAVRAHPDQWFWFHKRWKRHHPELYPEYRRRRSARKRRRRKRRLAELKKERDRLMKLRQTRGAPGPSPPDSAQRDGKP